MLIEFGFWKFIIIHDIIYILLNKNIVSLLVWLLGKLFFHSLLLDLIITTIFRFEFSISIIE